MKRRSDEEISAPLYEYDAAVRSQYGCFAGVDEAGRGPLCGPVCVAACILDPENPVFGINDSKKLTEKKREALFDEIIEKALAYKIVFVGPEIIDRDNILNATMGGMKQAVEELDIVPNLVLVDGNRTPAGLQIPAQPVVKGDATSASIGAASILAKVSRDRYMLELDRQYPQYQLAKHKGYPTKLHYELIEQYGIQPEESIAFGDSENDNEMLRAAGIGVAMGNALEETKAASDYVTDDCDDEGVAHALAHFALI